MMEVLTESLKTGAPVAVVIVLWKVIELLVGLLKNRNGSKPLTEKRYNELTSLTVAPFASAVKEMVRLMEEEKDALRTMNSTMNGMRSDYNKNCMQFQQLQRTMDDIWKFLLDERKSK